MLWNIFCTLQMRIHINIVMPLYNVKYVSLHSISVCLDGIQG